MMTELSTLKTLPAIDLEFPRGLPGLERAKSFHLEPLGGDLNVFGQLSSIGPVNVLGQTEAREISIVVAAPGLLWPDYSIEVDDESLAVLELEHQVDAIALVIINLADQESEPTANLFAPIVVNVVRRIALQVVPTKIESESPWSMRAPIPGTLTQ